MNATYTVERNNVCTEITSEEFSELDMVTDFASMTDLPYGVEVAKAIDAEGTKVKVYRQS